MDFIEDHPVCQDCPGYCCDSFVAVVPRDGRPWMRRRLEKRVAVETPWTATGAAMVGADSVTVACRCQHHVGGRCAIYADRPLACREFPSRNQIEAGIPLEHPCRLLDELMRNDLDGSVSA